MTTILLDRDRDHGSALAQVVSRRQGSDDVVIIADPDDLPRLLANDPDALVVVDEGAVDDPGRLQELIATCPTARFVVLVSTMRSTALGYLDEGAQALVHRPVALRTLGPAVDAAASGLRAVPPELMRSLLDHLHLSERTEANEGRLARLSPRELEILELLVDGLDPAQVAQALDLSVHTVRSHLKRMFRKLDVHSRLGAVLVGVGAGMVPAEVT